MNILNSVDTKTMAHIGVEIVVIGGITFWLNKRISGVQEIAEALTKKIESLESIIQQQEQIISRHENILRQMMGHQPRQPQPQSQPRQPQPQSQPRQPRQPQPQSQPRQQPPDQEMSPEDLDKLLGEELSNINNARDEKCTLKPKKTRKKGRRRKTHGD